MLTKLLVTLLIIAGAIFYIRKPKVEQRSSSSVIEQGQGILFKYIAMAIAVVALLGSGAYWYWSWQSGNEIVHITIVSPNEENSQVYQVHKRDIGVSEITTVDGIKIRLSNQERVVIAPTVSR